MRKQVYGHLEVYGGRKPTKVQIATRWNTKTFYKLTQLCEKEEVSVNSKVNEIVEKYLGVK
jgi:hypothetical protein